MNVFRIVAMIVFGLAFFASSTEAKETTLMKRDNGLLGAMNRMGCRPVWLSVVMRDNALLESDLLHLRTGMPLNMPDVCASEVPARADRITTNKIFRHQSEAVAGSQLAQENERLTRDLNALNDHLSLLSKQLDNAEKQNEQLKKQAQTRTPVPPTWKMRVEYSGIGLAVGLTAWGLWYFFWLPRIGGVVLDTEKVVYAGNVTEFTLSQILYKCKKHPNKEIDRKHLKRHVIRGHAGERLTVNVVQDGVRVVPMSGIAS